jgi:zinc-ribbon domain
MPIITCPHCGAERNTPREKLPRKPVNARCPKCRVIFRFDPAGIVATEPVVQSSSREISCPHCGLPRAIPNHRQTNAWATVSCRRCQHSFRLVRSTKIPTNTPQTTTCKLNGIGRLLTGSWELFCQRGWGLLAIYLLSSLLIFTPLLLATLLLPPLVKHNQLLVWTSLAGGSLFGLFGGAWMTASMFNHICNSTFGVFAAIGKGWQQLWKYAGLTLLLGLIVTGGSLLLIIPGIVFIIWFFFCQYILADEGLGGWQALERSRQLVRGHWWAIFGRCLLLVLVMLTVSVLTARIPVIGAPLNFAFSLLLTPFSLIYFYQLYKDLKRCQQQPTEKRQHSFGLPMATALLGWMLIPGLLFAVNNWQKLPSDQLAAESSALISKLFNHDQALLLERSEQQPQWQPPPIPEALTLADYDRLLNDRQLPKPQQGIKLGPATLSAEHFWSDEQEPHLWLKLQLAQLPNLALSHNHSTRILIDKVLDSAAQDRYNREHSFEHAAFHWIDILADDPEQQGYGGIRNVYLKQGTRPEQIRSIVGQLEINLPLGIESLQLNRNDIGKTLQVAGKSLTVENMNAAGITLRFEGRRSELLSIRAVNQQAEPLREAGSTWQKIGQAFSLKQMFSGDIDSVTVLVASDSVTRSYPFEITR